MRWGTDREVNFEANHPLSARRNRRLQPIIFVTGRPCQGRPGGQPNLFIKLAGVGSFPGEAAVTD
jgi:hypothetical protein